MGSSWLYTGILFYTVTLAACGMKANPVPRETVVPVPVEGVELTVTSEGMKLVWPLPSRSLDGLPLRELAGYKVVREGPDGKNIRQEVWFPVSERKSRVGGKVLFIDAFPEQKGTYFYSVIPFDAYGSSPRQGERIEVTWEGQDR
jgi:hypothetical protein